MRHAPTTAIALALTIGLAAEAPAEPVTAAPVIEVAAPSEADREHAAWALERLELAGLDLPTMTIVFHDTYEACGMRQGVLRMAGDSITVHECERDDYDIRRSLLHELVHAWDQTSPELTDTTRTKFLELRGLEEWNKGSLEWPHRGEEQAAEIIVWGLLEGEVPIPTRVGKVGDQDTASLTAAFRLLTGTDPLWAEPLTAEPHE